MALLLSLLSSLLSLVVKVNVCFDDIIDYSCYCHSDLLLFLMPLSLWSSVLSLLGCCYGCCLCSYCFSCQCCCYAWCQVIKDDNNNINANNKNNRNNRDINMANITIRTRAINTLEEH